MEKKTLAELKTQFEKFKVNYEYQLIMSNISFLNCFFEFQCWIATVYYTQYIN